MKPLRWERIKQIFDDALAHVGDRETFVKSASDGDTELAGDVQSLLVAHDRTGIVPSLSDPQHPPGSDWLGADAVEDRLTAALAGQYTIERVIGRGGMAIVLLAHDVRHERPVAIKVIRPDVGRNLA